MALVGTGINYYRVYNEAVTKRSDRIFDTLAHENVFDIISVSSRPVYSTKNNPENVYYKQIQSDDDYEGGDFELKEGKYIVWNTTDVCPDPELVTPSNNSSPYISEGSKYFHLGGNASDPNITFGLDTSVEVSGSTNVSSYDNSYRVIDGNWRIEVTYAAEQDGCYRIVNNDTNEILGEYAVSDLPNTVIPGIKVVVKSTYYEKNGENAINIGDYIIIKTTARKTEQEAAIKISAMDDTLKGTINTMQVINASRVIDAKYRLIITGASGGVYTYQLTQFASGTEVIIYPDSSDTTASATWIEGDELYDIIPGINIILGKIKSLRVTNSHSITFDTTARIVNEDVPGEGDTYYVSYKYRKAEDGYDAQYFTEYKDIVAEYGDYEVTASGVVNNSLTLGAEIAFTNGVQQIICVQAKGDTDAEFCDAIDRLKKTLPGVDNVNTIVPLTKSATVGAYCATHVTTMSSYDYALERMCYLGAYPNQPISKSPTGTDRSLGIIESCVGYANERVVYVVPGEVIKSIRDPNTGKTYDRPLPGCYLAVAVACLGLKDDPAAPMTNQAIAGFSYLTKTYNKTEMNLMANKGACIVYMRGTSFIVRHAVTTDPSDVNTTEITCIQIKDYVIEAVRSACQQYIGQKNTNDTVGNVQFTINSILSQFVNRTIIESYNSLSVSRSSDDPRAVVVEFSILPIYTLNYIMIHFIP